MFNLIDTSWCSIFRIFYKTESQIAFESRNIELIKYIILNKPIDVNSKDVLYIYIL